jgi:hypothetical protein
MPPSLDPTAGQDLRTALYAEETSIQGRIGCWLANRLVIKPCRRQSRFAAADGCQGTWFQRSDHRARSGTHPGGSHGLAIC